MTNTENPTAMILGATGLIGNHLLRLLLASPVFGRVIAPSRRKIELAHSKLWNPVTGLDALAEVWTGNTHVDVVFCCLGTTIKKAKTKEAFEQVDFAFPYEAAKLAKKYQVPHFAVVSAMGADPESFFFYNRVKGKLESHLRELAFPNLTIVRPSLLIGDRGHESRIMESVSAIGLNLAGPLMMGGLANFKPVEAEKVALRLLKESECVLARGRAVGVQIILSGEI